MEGEFQHYNHLALYFALIMYVAILCNLSIVMSSIINTIVLVDFPQRKNAKINWNSASMEYRRKDVENMWTLSKNILLFLSFSLASAGQRMIDFISFVLTIVMMSQTFEAIGFLSFSIYAFVASFHALKISSCKESQ